MISLDNKKAHSSLATEGFNVVNTGILTMMNIPFTINSSKTLDFIDLLPSIPSHITLKSLRGQELTDEEFELIKNIDEASENAISALPSGISAIGELLAYSADKVTPEAITNIGWLLDSLGRQVGGLLFLKEATESTLRSDLALKGKKGGLMS
ncbi:hypothetical protein [Acinetobacter baumannii]|uniref:hypothetical protein n=1 Tax=Acinetobacter baumannii TaxID=470 RepID=UPI0034D01D9E